MVEAVREMKPSESLGLEFAAFIARRCKERSLEPVEALTAMTVCASALICTISNDAHQRDKLADGLAFTVKLQNQAQPLAMIQ